MALTQISTGGIKDDAVTEAKLPANSVGNSEMKDDAVGVAELSATGTASSSTFLRGDNSWVTPTDTNTQRAFANDGNNRVVTGDGSGGLNGEANLTFDGDTLATVKMSCTVGGDVTASTWNRTDANEAWVSHRFYTQSNVSGHIQVNVGSVTYSTSSDYRLKENIVDLTGAIARVKTLKPKRFNFKIRPADTVDGFLAHEVTTVPEATTGIKDEVDSDGNPVYQGIDQSKIVPLLTACMQEAIEKIEILETKVAALESA